MPYSIALFCTRKPGVTPTEFKDHWENTHVPLLKTITGTHFPLEHMRRYIAHADSENAFTNAGKRTGDDRRGSNPPLVLVGRREEVDWDGFAELTFRDRLHFEQFFSRVNEEEVARRIEEDEARFMDPSKLKVVVLGDVRTCTTRD